MYIYKITNKINGKIYIGQTINDPKIRFSRHIYDAVSNKSDTPLHRAIRRYGKENFEMTIVDTATNIEELNKKEEELISYSKSLVFQKGYNVEKGGLNKTKTEESLRKVSESLKEAYRTGKKERKRTDTTDNLRKRALNFFSSEENKIKFNIANGSKYFSVYEAIELRKNKRGVSKIVEKGKLLGTFLTLKEAKEKIGFKCRQAANKCLLGQKKTYSNLIFEYLVQE